MGEMPDDAVDIWNPLSVSSRGGSARVEAVSAKSTLRWKGYGGVRVVGLGFGDQPMRGPATREYWESFRSPSP